MAIPRNVFITDADRAALAALKAVPGFEQLTSLFMRVWDENLTHIKNMASKVRLSEDQLPHYYEMLLPICEKLGIEIPELYIELNPFPNAYAAGNTKASITITSGLLETIPDELMPTVLAHECGHIACHHVLYTTMGQWLMNTVGNGLLPLIPGPIAGTLANIASTSLIAAFSFWMRCSEYSADRAAILCDGTPDKTFEVCLRLSGFDKDIIQGEASFQAFFDQAREYKAYIKNNPVNSAMEAFLYYDNDHPVSAVRALEALEWSESDNFKKSKLFFDSFKSGQAPAEIPLAWNEKHFFGRPFDEVKQEIEAAGFTDVQLIRTTEKPLFMKDSMVIAVDIDGSRRYDEGDWYTADSTFNITYYLPLSEDEIAAMHEGQLMLDRPLKSFVGKACESVVADLEGLGFTNIIVDEVKDIVKPKDRNLGKVASITIDKSPVYSKGEWVPKDSLVEITQHSMK